MSKKQLADIVKAYLDDARLFTDALEELQGQVTTIESELQHKKKSSSSSSDVLKHVLEKANTVRFKQYVEGTLPPPPTPDLATRIDENIRLLSVLQTEMGGQVKRIESLQEALKTHMQASFDRFNVVQEEQEQEEEQMGDNDCDVNTASSWKSSANDALLAAGIVDALKLDFKLIEKVTGAVSVLTPSADISSYVTILRIQPYLPSGLLEEVLSWRRIESTREK